MRNLRNGFKKHAKLQRRCKLQWCNQVIRLACNLFNVGLTLTQLVLLLLTSRRRKRSLKIHGSHKIFIDLHWTRSLIFKWLCMCGSLSCNLLIESFLCLNSGCVRLKVPNCLSVFINDIWTSQSLSISLSHLKNFEVLVWLAKEKRTPVLPSVATSSILFPVTSLSFFVLF